MYGGSCCYGDFMALSVHFSHSSVEHPTVCEDSWNSRPWSVIHFLLFYILHLTSCYFLVLHDSYEFTWISIDIRIITFHIFLQKHAWVCLFGTAGVAHMLNRVTGWPLLGIFPMPNAWRRLSIFGVPFPNWQSQGGFRRVGDFEVQPEKKGSGWWQLKYFLFAPRKLGEDEPILTSIFFRWVARPPKKGVRISSFRSQWWDSEVTLPKGKYTYSFFSREICYMFVSTEDTKGE